MRRTLRVVVALAGLAAILPAQAQAQMNAQMNAEANAPSGAQGLQAARAQCMTLPSDAERLACLNDALDRLETTLSQPSAPSAPVAAPPAAAVAPAELGAEQVAARQDGGASPAAMPDETVHAAIVSAEETVPGRMILELDNGQVWRQLDGDARGLYFTSGATAVEIRRGRLGGYRMTLIDQRQMLRVERLR